MKRLLSLVLAVSITATTSFAHTLTTASNPCTKPGYVKVHGTQFTYDGYQLDNVRFYITSNGQSWGTILWDTTFYVPSATFDFYVKVVSPTLKIFIDENQRNNTHSSWHDEYNGSGIVFSPCTTMPVLLTDYSVSKVSDSKVLVKWTTTSEQNNSHFTVQGSTDGLNYTDIGMVFSYTESGNSSVSHDYAFTFDNTVHVVKAGLGILSIIFLVLIVAAGFKRKSFPFAAMALIITLGSFTACSKSNAVPSTNATYKFIRLQQVDKDGTVTTYDTKTVN